MSDYWRDQHRHNGGRFKPRPGAKVMKPPQDPPPEKGTPLAAEKRQPSTFALWVESARDKDRC